MTKLATNRFNALALAAAVAVGGLTVAPAAQAELSGNISVFSKYVLRGITTAAENEGAVVQGGFDYTNASGFYAGYWGSSLGYNGGEPEDAGTGFESDFYGGYAGEAAGIAYDVGLIYYYYMDMDDADTAELAASVGYGPFSFGLKYLLGDVVWGNQGDIYWTLGYETDLPAGFGFAATAGFYTYEEDGEFITGSESSGFRHLDLTLSHPIGDTGADMSLTYILGGVDRFDNDQGDTMVLGISYGFDI